MGKLNSDASAYILQFDIPVVKKEEGHVDAPSKATVFISLKLSVNGEIVNLPQFPGPAPNAPFLNKS